MKKSIISSIILLAIILACYQSFTKNEKDILIQANIEALADEEGAVIVCDSGNCGQCFYEVTAWPFYKCVWSGRQADYCDCNKAGYLSNRATWQ